MRMLHIERRRVKLDPVTIKEVAVPVCDVTGQRILKLQTGDVVFIPKEFEGEQKFVDKGKRHQVRTISDDETGRTVEIRRTKKMRP